MSNYTQATVGILNPLFYGASANNLAVAVSLANPWAYGIAAAAGYVFLADTLEPDDVFEWEGQ